MAPPTQMATHLCARTCESSVAFSCRTPFHSFDSCTTKHTTILMQQKSKHLK